jgi:hypothetical protein
VVLSSERAATPLREGQAFRRLVGIHHERIFTPGYSRRLYYSGGAARYVHGQRDYRFDVSQGFDLFTTLQRLGVPSEMLYFPDEGHWVLKPQNSRLWYETVNAWVDRWTAAE